MDRHSRGGSLKTAAQWLGAGAADKRMVCLRSERKRLRAGIRSQRIGPHYLCAVRRLRRLYLS